MKSKARQISDWLIPALLALAAFLVRLPLMKVRLLALSGDEATIGIMAADILQGKFPVYYYGQSYMGALEAYIIALISIFSGVDAWTVQIGTFLSYAGLIVVHYFLVKKVFGRIVSLFSSLLLVVAPLMFWELSVKALGGYSEIFCLGALLYWLWLKVYEDQDARWRFPLGLCIGLGLWVNPVFLLYLFPLILATPYWHKGFSNRCKWLNPGRLLFLRDLEIPLVFKIPFWLIHAGIFLYLGKQIAVFAAGGWDIHWMGLDFTTPAFQWKNLKRIFLILTGEAAVVALLVMGVRSLLKFIQKWLGLIAGVLVGQIPVFLFNILGGEGYRILHASGAIEASQFSQKIKLLFLKLIPLNTFGADDLNSGHSYAIFWGWFVLFLWGAGLVCFFASQYKAVKQFVIKGKGIADPRFLFALAGAMMLAAIFLSTLSADRYLAPFYWVMTIFAGAFLGMLWQRGRWTAIVLGCSMVGFYMSADAWFVTHYPPPLDTPGLIRVLKEEGTATGRSSYDQTYRLVFYSRREMKFIPFSGMLRIPEYENDFKQSPVKALVFPDSESEQEFLDHHRNFIPLKMVRFKNFRIYMTDRSL